MGCECRAKNIRGCEVYKQALSEVGTSLHRQTHNQTPLPEELTELEMIVLPPLMHLYDQNKFTCEPEKALGPLIQRIEWIKLRVD